MMIAMMYLTGVRCEWVCDRVGCSLYSLRRPMIGSGRAEKMVNKQVLERSKKCTKARQFCLRAPRDCSHVRIATPNLTPGSPE